MSTPHTGKLTALIQGFRFSFDGETWALQGTKDRLTAGLEFLLNDATESAPKTHFNIRELALHVLRKTDLYRASSILEVTPDAWQKQLPPDAID